MKIEDVEVYGFRKAFHGMRNAMDSWDNADSLFWGKSKLSTPFPETSFKPTYSWNCDVYVPELPDIGEKDLELACNLIKRGSEHRKFLRQIIIWMDITIPRYVWQELDTYKVATVRNSCSTMNKLGSRDLTQDDFELPICELTLERINLLARLLREAKSVHENVQQTRRQLKNELCEGYLQKATYMLNYETALSVILQRQNHRLPEWKLVCDSGSITDFLISLPYMFNFYMAATEKKRILRRCIDNLSSLIVSDHFDKRRVDADFDIINSELISILADIKKAV